MPEPALCPFCQERLYRAAQHGHVDQEWAARAAAEFARQCCTYPPNQAETRTA